MHVGELLVGLLASLLDQTLLVHTAEDPVLTLFVEGRGTFLLLFNVLVRWDWGVLRCLGRLSPDYVSVISISLHLLHLACDGPITVH